MKELKWSIEKERKIIRGILIVLCIVLSMMLKYNLSNNKEGESLSQKELYEKGYDLPINEKDKRESEKECEKVMGIVYKIYENSDKGNSINITIPEETVKQMYDAIAAAGIPVSDSGNKYGMANHKKMEQFLNHSSSGIKSEIVVYRVLTNGGIARQKFIFDGKDMYSLYTNAVWNKNMLISITATSYTRIKEWSYTEKGWFRFAYCVPEYPEVTEIMNGNMLIRVKPFNSKYQEMTEKYLVPVSYQGNNMLCSNWDEEHMEHLDYTGLFESLYFIKYGDKLPFEQYSCGIPRDMFEDLMTEYLPVSREQLEEYAVYNKKNKVYEWDRLGCGNYSPNAFNFSYPEVTEIGNNADGTLTLTVDAVCEASDNDDALTHKITVRLFQDGSIKYLSNQIAGDGLQRIPAYQYRISKIPGDS
ncbi:DUF6070 family protein [Lacrimispora sp. BS-2]|uniref:DUF6070 family protein n=1 Tax=Lacrimispora sp. BS-2 TaxID=3151850 RepID=A0AAU7PN67_9FIRM